MKAETFENSYTKVRMQILSDIFTCLHIDFQEDNLSDSNKRMLGMESEILVEYIINKWRLKLGLNEIGLITYYQVNQKELLNKELLYLIKDFLSSLSSASQLNDKYLLGSKDYHLKAMQKILFTELLSSKFLYLYLINFLEYRE
jgi:hypothetical protein